MLKRTISIISNGFHELLVYKHYGARVGDDFVTKKQKITNLKDQMVIQ